MEICFVDGAIEPFLEERLARDRGNAENDARASGSGAEVVDRSGRQLGTAGPYYRYTVGQRRGLGVAGGDRLYVLEIQPAENRVVVGARATSCASNGLLGERLHWIGPPPSGDVEATVRIRSRHAGVEEPDRVASRPARRRSSSNRRRRGSRPVRPRSSTTAIASSAAAGSPVWSWPIPGWRGGGRHEGRAAPRSGGHPPRPSSTPPRRSSSRRASPRRR